VLIVTHQKRTMEIAQMMYGVSMSKEGTSKVIGQRLETPPPPAHERPEREPLVAVSEPDAVH